MQLLVCPWLSMCQTDLCCLCCGLGDDLTPSVARVLRVGRQVEGHPPKLSDSEGERPLGHHLSQGVDAVV